MSSWQISNQPMNLMSVLEHPERCGLCAAGARQLAVVTVLWRRLPRRIRGRLVVTSPRLVVHLLGSLRS